MRTIARIAVYLLAFVTLPLGVGFVFFRSAIAAYLAPSPDFHLQAGQIPQSPLLDPRKPTVAVVLGNDITEVADVIAPYAVFQTSAMFNVVTVAEERRPVALTGGLDVLPHYSFRDLDTKNGAGPALIVVPNIPNVEANEAVRAWVQRQGREGSVVMSVCAGAQMLAATGLIDGQRATTHWGDIGRLERQFRAVTWVRGERYIDNGQVVSTAGILSGIDGALHMIDRLRGRALASEVAGKMHYTDLRYLDDTSMPQLEPAAADAIVLLNAAYLWDRPILGVALHDGVDDVALAAVYDTYGLTDRLLSIAPEGGLITTARGLNLVARHAPGGWPASREILTVAAAERFPFERALDDIARRHNLPTARFAAKRLEYRMSVIGAQGRGWSSIAVVYRPLLLGLFGVGLVIGFKRLLARSRRRRASAALIMNAIHKKMLEEEVGLAEDLIRLGKYDDAFLHLQSAHVLGQAYIRWHVVSHWLMLKVAVRRRQPMAAAGQLARIFLGALGSALGRVPTGNTGGSDISMFKRMPIAPELSRVMEGRAG